MSLFLCPAHVLYVFHETLCQCLHFHAQHSAHRTTVWVGQQHSPKATAAGGRQAGRQVGQAGHHGTTTTTNPTAEVNNSELYKSQFVVAVVGWRCVRADLCAPVSDEGFSLSLVQFYNLPRCWQYSRGYSRSNKLFLDAYNHADLPRYLSEY